VEDGTRVRLAVMASHAHADLLGAARGLGRAAGRAGLRGGRGVFDAEDRMAA
jgi:hypothetical protein